MSEHVYFIVHRSVGESTSITGPYTEDEVLLRITPSHENKPGGGYEGCNAYGMKRPRFLDLTALEGRGEFGLSNIATDELLVLRTRVVVPKPVKVVHTYTLRKDEA